MGFDREMLKIDAEKKVNVLFVIMQMAMGGSERLVHNIVSKLDRRVFNPSVAWFFGESPLQEYLELGIPLHRIPKEKRFDLAAMRLLGQIVEKNRIDIVNAHHFMSMVYAFYGCKVRRQSSLVYTAHSEWEIQEIPKRWRVIGDILLKRIDCAVGVAPAVTDKLKQVFKLPDRLTSTILNGVDIDKFTMNSHTAREIKRSLKIGDRELVVGTVGNLKRVKNHDFLITGFGELVKSLRNVRVIIVGQGFRHDPENSEQELKDRVRELGLTDKVSFLGYRSDVHQLLRIIDVFCLTSLKEGLPIGLIEAMAAGLPVIGTNVEGIRDMLVPNEDGVLVNLGDTGALKNALFDLLTNPDLRSRLGKAARKKVKETYSLQRCVREYEALFLDYTPPHS